MKSLLSTLSLIVLCGCGLLSGIRQFDGKAPSPVRMAVMPPTLPPLPQRTNATAPRLSRSAMLAVPAPVSLGEWANGLAGSNGGTCELRPDGSLVIDSRVLAHYNLINMLADKTPSLLLPLGNTWLLTSNQAKEFMALDQKLRLEKNLALYSGQ